MANGKISKTNGNGKPTALTVAEDGLERFARNIAIATGRPSAFLTALALVIIWGATGPFFHYSDSWQLVINTGTTIITFLMVFLIQRAQNRDTLALQVKLAELIIAMKGAQNKVAMAEDMPEHELAALHEQHTEAAEEIDQLEDVSANAKSSSRSRAKK